MTKYTLTVNLSLPQFRYDLKRLHIAFLSFQIEFPHLISFQVRGRKMQETFLSRAAPGSQVSTDSGFACCSGAKPLLQDLLQNTSQFGCRFVNLRATLQKSS